MNKDNIKKCEPRPHSMKDGKIMGYCVEKDIHTEFIWSVKEQSYTCTACEAIRYF